MEPKKKFGLRRILSVVLCLSMLLSPVVTLAESVINEGIESLAEPELILIQTAETKTVYKLVENYTAADISTSKTYMIVSTDVPGEASALGGAQRADGRYLQTLDGLKVFEIPVQTTSLDPGKYVTNTFSSAEFGEWKFESAGSNAYYLVTTSKDNKNNTYKGYLAQHPNGGSGGYHSGYFSLALDKSEGRTSKWIIANDNVDLAGLKTIYTSSYPPSVVTVDGKNAGYLSYGVFTAQDNKQYTNFNMVAKGSAKTMAQLYEKVGSKPIPEIKGYLYSNEGTVAVNTGKFAPTGAYIHLYVDGKLTRVPVTTDMLSGADLTKAGEYKNVKVSYNGVQLADDFTLKVEDAITIVNGENKIFKLADPDSNDVFVHGGEIYIAETQEPGYVRILSTNGSIFGSNQVPVKEIYVNGERQLIIDDLKKNSVWVTEATTHPNLSSTAKCWNLKSYVGNYLRFNGNSDWGKTHALACSDSKTDWPAIFHDRGEGQGLAVYNHEGTYKKDSDGYVYQNEKWNTMYYNYNVGNFGMRVEVANGSAKGPTTSGTISTSEAQPYDRVFFYTRTGEYANVSVYLTNTSGTVPYGATSADSPTGVYLVMTVTDAYGVSHITNIPVTLDMLTYERADGVMDSIKTKTATESDVVYDNVNITYQGVAISTNFKVTVEKKLPENDYPPYPDPGSVAIKKGLNEEYDYLATGLTEVQLTLTGIPDASGSDVVLVLDNSGSMANSVDGTGALNSANSRRNEMVQSIKNMLTRFSETIDGFKSDIAVSIITFDGYTLIDPGMIMGTAPGTTGSVLATTHDQPDTSHFLTPSKSGARIPEIEDRFIHASDLDANKIQTIATNFANAYTGSGTNYDRGLHLAYETLAGKQKLNAQNGTKRNSYVIFMSDGCPWQFNYVGGGSTEGAYVTWDYYLSGELDKIPAESRPENEKYSVFANSDGKHWMAEAIKGDTDKRYKTINPSANKDNNYVEWVNGLGAEMFVVGFGIVKDNAVQESTVIEILEGISSGAVRDNNGNLLIDDPNNYFYDVKNVGEIQQMFDKITTKIRAASGAVFEDKLGAAFDLQMSSTVAGPRGPITLDPKPSVEVYEFITYRADQVGTIVDNILVTEDMVGTVRPGYESGTLIEQITFDDAGTEAYSSITGAGVNVIDGNGIINAVTFRYNTSKTETIKIDSNADSILDYDLPPETFAWLVGDIPQSRYELHYDVYLEGSMEGEVSPADKDFFTNEYAVLKYKNYIGNASSITAPKPQLSWKEAEVTYSYYLVNGRGEPIDANGNVTTFDKALKIGGLGDVTKQFKLNQRNVIVDGDGEGQIPDAYQLYDDASAFKILAHSKSAATGDWTIDKSADKPLTTYVESGALLTTGNTYDNSNANYRQTKVWFALVPKVCVDDTVVIDYGIPVDVDVLANDDFNGDVENATITGYAPKVDAPSYFDLTSDTPDGFVASDKTLNGAFGKFSCVDNEIRYQLDEMQMTDVDAVTYGAQYSGSEMPNGKYYGNLTVIPATLIYFEDDFVSFTVNNYSEEGEVIANSWTTVGTEKDDVQRDDRVGETIANVYGNDGAYVDSSKYSFGSAQKVTVERTDKYDENGRIASSTGKYATATFTFVGKGFDVISYTTNKTGTIAVQVFPYASLDATAPEINAVKSTVVDTYYGYKYAKVPVLDRDGNQIIEDGKPLYTEKWVPAESDTEDGLYQVPVIKWSTDTYGKYKVVITASYNWIFDHGQYGGSRLPNNKANATREGKYDFYLDAIRIYDPANGGANDEDIKNAYIADGEYMPTFKELRNILISDVKGFAADGSNVDGAVYIDNTSDSIKNTYTLNEYKDFGPNNEVYLAKGNAVAFTVDKNGYASVQLAAKLAKGTGTLKIKNVTNGLDKTLNITTATDLYYALDDILADNKANTVVLQNLDGNGIISVTNLKLTKTATVDAQVQTVNAVYMNAKTAQAAVDYLNATQAPEIHSVKSMKPSVKAGQKFTVTVTTNSEAEYVVVNGQTFTKYTENKANGQRIWKVTLALEGKGMAQISANAYGANDVESRTVSTTVRVTKAPAFSIGGVFDGFFGGLLGK